MTELNGLSKDIRTCAYIIIIIILQKSKSLNTAVLRLFDFFI